MGGKTGVRLNPMHQDLVRAKIQASAIITHFQAFFFGEKVGSRKINLSPEQIRVGHILLDKSLPSLSNVELTGKGKMVWNVSVVRFSEPSPDAQSLAAAALPAPRLVGAGTGMPPARSVLGEATREG